MQRVLGPSGPFRIIGVHPELVPQWLHLDKEDKFQKIKVKINIVKIVATIYQKPKHTRWSSIEVKKMWQMEREKEHVVTDPHKSLASLKK